MNIEQILIEYLSGALGIGCYAEVPAARPDQFVTVERTGGDTTFYLDRPSVAIQWWANTRYEASELCIKGVSALASLIDEPNIMDVSIGSSYNFPDPDSQQSRYQTTINIVTA